MAQIVLQGQPFAGFLVHLPLKEAEGVFTRVLGMIHGNIGMHQQFINIFSVIGKEGDADAAAEENFLVLKREGRFKSIMNLSGNYSGIRTIGDVLDKYRKFITPETGQG